MSKDNRCGCGGLRHKCDIFICDELRKNLRDKMALLDYVICDTQYSSIEEAEKEMTECGWLDDDE